MKSLDPPVSVNFTIALNWRVELFDMASSTNKDDKSLGPVYFWQETESPYGPLSQWWESPFEVDGVTYQSAEMWMMVQKAKLFGDEETVRQMLESTSPKEHKALGRMAKGFNGKKWDARE